MNSTRGTRWRNLFALCLTRIKDDENNCCNFSLFVVLGPLLYSQSKLLFALFSLEEEEKEEVAES